MTATITPIERHSGRTRRYLGPALLAGAWAVSAGMALPLAIEWSTNPAARLVGDDWQVLTEAGERVAAGLDPYAFTVGDASYRWSPLVAYLCVFIAPVGPTLWAALWASALLLVDWRIGLLVLTSVPFWLDVGTGLSFTFILIAAILAVRHPLGGGLAWVALSFLIPRPLMLALLVWLLWTQPRLRWPAAGVAAVILAGSLATGWLGSWVSKLTSIVADGDSGWLVIAPASILGPLWPVVAVVAAGWLARRGLVGMASMALSPYWLPGYYQILFMDLARRWPAASWTPAHLNRVWRACARYFRGRRSLQGER